MLFINEGIAQVKIMPLGNSITYDHNSTDVGNPRPTGDRISYRFTLSQILNSEGFDFDFVGNKNAGNNYFNNVELDDNAGFPGIRDDQMADLINTGYNQYANQQEAPGPYLNYYSADIILLHIGTNGLTTYAGDVEHILDNIRSYDSDVYILVAKIINRSIYHSATTIFNTNVEAMVGARNDNRIIMVDIENGAGMNYSNDMVDNLHPNPSGYNKMANKWFEAIDNLNQNPVITGIPDQVTEKGDDFLNISLDSIVGDTEDPDYLLQWSFTQEANSNFNVSIDGNRILNVSPNNREWLGSENIWLKVEDTGNGAFRKSDSIQVLFTVQLTNNKPVIESDPLTSSDDYEEYSYTIVASDTDGDDLSYFIAEKPSWLSFDSGSKILSGIPEWHHAGSFYDVSIGVADQIDTVYQSFALYVSNNNDPPEFTSEPDTIAFPDSILSYDITFSDKDVDDELIMTVLTSPSWLLYFEGNNSFNGSPTNLELNKQFPVVLELSDGKTTVYQTYIINVQSPTGTTEIKNLQDNLKIFPNPSNGIIHLQFEKQDQKCEIKILNVQGELVQSINTISGDQDIILDLSFLQSGLYFISLNYFNRTYTRKILMK